MALLQVRNCPDDIYEKLAQMAKRDNRSIAQETIHILREAVGAEGFYGPSPFSPHLVEYEEDQGPLSRVERNRQRTLDAIAATEALNIHLPEWAQTPEEIIREERDR